MSTLTDWQTVEDGQTTQLDLTGVGVLEWARIRWRGRDTTKTEYQYPFNEVSDHQEGAGYLRVDALFPSVPLGWELFRHRTTVRIGSDTCNEWDVNVSEEYQGLKKIAQNQGTCTRGNVTHYWPEDESINGTSGVGVHLDYDYTLTVFAYTYCKRDVSYGTANPQVTINTEVTTGPSSLDDEEVSEWYDLDGLSAGVVNDILHAIDSSETADYQIEYESAPPTVVEVETLTTAQAVAPNPDWTFVAPTVVEVDALATAQATAPRPDWPGQPMVVSPTAGRSQATAPDPSYGVILNLPPPELHEPIAEYATYDRQFAEFEFTLTEGSGGVMYHASLILRGTEYRTEDDQNPWDYWDGSSWQDFPSGGVDPGSRVRFTYDQVWPLGSHTWQARTFAYSPESDLAEGSWSYRTLHIERLPAPAHTSPGDGTDTEDRQPDFTFTLPSQESSATAYHAQIQLSEYIGFSTTVYDVKTSDSITGWQYWDGSNWVTFPTGGVPPGTSVRWQPPDDLAYGSVYWRARAEDDWDFSNWSTPWRLTVRIVVDWPYRLEIEGVPYDLLSLRVSEASNGEIGEMRFALFNDAGQARDQIDYLDTVNVGIIDSRGHERDYQGVIRDMEPQGEVLVVTAVKGDGILADRYVEEDYASQDIGLTVKAMIDDYADGLTSMNVDTSTAHVAPVKADGKTVLRVLESLRRQYQLYYFVDDDWDLHWYREAAIAAAEQDRQIRYKE